MADTKRVSLNEAELSIVEKTRRLVKLHARLRRMDSERETLLAQIVDAEGDVRNSLPPAEVTISLYGEAIAKAALPPVE